jgi:hypothetical protein
MTEELYYTWMLSILFDIIANAQKPRINIYVNPEVQLRSIVIVTAVQTNCHSAI